MINISRNNLQTTGSFSLGCNYWASHAGTAMWTNWQPKVVQEDFAKLAAHGLEKLRVFPLWPDFQPITQMWGGGGARVEIRLGEDPLPFDPIGQAGVSRIMLGRYADLCDLAQAAGLKIIAGLVTGWMSGRLFVPPALEGRNPITDPISLAWQTKFVKAFVTNLRDHEAIIAWDLGNECNCMGPAPSREAAYVWTSSIATSIRWADATRPIVSGMHSLSTPVGSQDNPWTIDDQGALTDILTTHPYPYWTRHTRTDAVNALRTTFHATAETRFYGDISGKPCFAEEIGTMGPMIAGDQVSADFARVNLFSLWANDCRGFFWWCAHDQTLLTHAPYDWNGVESELGLLRNDGTPKPVLQEMAAFRQFLNSLPFTELPKCRTDAVCLLTHNQDDWAVAYGAYILGKQAKLNLSFRHIQQSIPEAQVYLLPSLKGANCIPRRQWLDLVERTKAGATLYISLGDGVVPHFNKIAGIELLTRASMSEPLKIIFGGPDGPSLSLTGGDDLVIEARGAEVLATVAKNGSPAVWRHRLGKGNVVVCVAPLELHVTLTRGAFDDAAMPYSRIYEEIARTVSIPRLLTVKSESLAVTEHALGDGRTAVVAINHSGAQQVVLAAHAEGVVLSEVWRGDVNAKKAGSLLLTLPPHDAAVFALKLVDAH